LKKKHDMIVELISSSEVIFYHVTDGSIH